MVLRWATCPDRSKGVVRINSSPHSLPRSASWPGPRNAGDARPPAGPHLRRLPDAFAAGAYRGLLESALAADYEIVSVEHMWSIIAADRLDPARCVFVLRHDIDTDRRPRRRCGDRSRPGRGELVFLSALDPRPGAHADIAAAAARRATNYEELATVAKLRRLRSGSDAIAHLPELATGSNGISAGCARSPACRCASLPPWRLRKPCSEVTELADPRRPAFRHQVDVELETYDEALLRHLPSRYTDVLHPEYWSPGDPTEAIHRREPTIQSWYIPDLACGPGDECPRRPQKAGRGPALRAPTGAEPIGGGRPGLSVPSRTPVRRHRSASRAAAHGTAEAAKHAHPYERCSTG